MPQRSAMPPLIVIQLDYVHFVLLAASHQMLAVEIGHPPEEVLVHIAESVSLTGKKQQVEALVGPYQGVDHPDGVCRIHIVIHISCAEQQMSLEP